VFGVEARRPLYETEIRVPQLNLFSFCGAATQHGLWPPRS